METSPPSFKIKNVGIHPGQILVQLCNESEMAVEGSGGFRGGADGGNCPPFTMEIQLWRPLFSKKSAPYPDPNALFFQ